MPHTQHLKAELVLTEPDATMLASRAAQHAADLAVDSGRYAELEDDAVRTAVHDAVFKALEGLRVPMAEQAVVVA